MKKANIVPLMLRLPAALAKAIKTQAKKEERSINNLIVHTLEQSKDINSELAMLELRVYDGRRWIKPPPHMLKTILEINAKTLEAAGDRDDQ